MDTCYINDGNRMMNTKQGSRIDQTGVVPDSYVDTVTDSYPVAQLTWVPALDAAPRPVTERL